MSVKKPTRRQRFAMMSLGITSPVGIDRSQACILLKKEIHEVETGILILLEDASIRQHAIVAYKDEEWVVITPPMAQHLCLRKRDGGEKLIISPTGRDSIGSIYLKVKACYVPPDRYMHPFSLESDPRFAGTSHLVAVLNYLRATLRPEDCLETPFGTFWEKDVAAIRISAYIDDQRAADRANRSEKRKKAEIDPSIPARAFCVACGEQNDETTAQVDRRCADCRADNVRLEQERHCSTCGSRFIVNTNGAGRWYCAPHESST